MENYAHSPPVKQYMFHPTRRWKFDFCWPKQIVALEVQGLGPGHQSAKGMRQDYDKNLAAAVHGWKVIYIMNYHLDIKQINTTCKMIAQVLKIPPANQTVQPHYSRRKK